MKEKLTKLLKKLYRTGFAHIFSSEVLNKVVSMASGLLIVNLLSKEDYGVYSYANNILSTALLLSGLGLSSGILQAGSENMDDGAKQNVYYRRGLLQGLAFNIFLMFAIIIFCLLFQFPIRGAGPLLMLMSGLPILIFLVECFAIKFRIRLMNQQFAYLSLGISMSSSLMLILGAMSGSLSRLVLMRYLAYILVSGFFYNKYRPFLSFSKEHERGLGLSSEEKKSFYGVSFISLANNSLSSLLYIIDGWLIGGILKNSEVLAAYHTATLLPFALSFIPSGIVTYIYPYVADKRKDKKWLSGQLPKLYLAMAALNAFISLILIILAPLIFKIVFPKYGEVIPIFRLLSIGYFFTATFRIPSGNILVMLHQLRWNTVVAIVSGLLNIVLDYYLILRMGSMGAALATVGIFIISGLMSTGYLYYYIKYRLTDDDKVGPPDELDKEEKSAPEEDKGPDEGETNHAK